MINFFDFECYKHDWLVVIINPFEKTVDKIVNNVDKLREYYEKHKHEVWCGYNSRHYDQYILKALLAGFDAWEMNDFIINKNMPAWKFSSLLNKYPLINYDVALLGKSLKQLEGFQGHNIHETGVDFRIDRKLTEEEIEETFEYCQNDVEECINIWLECKEDYEAQMKLISMFNLPLSSISRTKAQITADILQCERVERDDEWDIFTLECLRLETEKYKKISKWFLTKENQDYSNSLKTDVCGIPHVFGWGGLHGAKEKYHYKCDKNHLILHVDVQSYYPSLMIFQGLLTRNAKAPELYTQIYHTRLDLKAQGKKKEQAPLKIVLNATYGICNDVKSKAYDSRNAHLICINGQLLLLDLLEKLEKIPSFELIQSNTDGLIIKIHRKDFDAVDDVCYEWEHRTKMNLEFDYIKEIFHKDVNNYVFVQFDGKVERKGAYVKELSNIDNDLPIINKAMVDYMLKGIPVEDTINNCDDLIQFQKICKLTSKFDYVEHRGKKYTNKCYRIFASNRRTDSTVYKVKLDEMVGERLFKFANTSERSFIENGDITQTKCPEYLDKSWYIDLACERLQQYGVEV